jgi:ABC-type multidrug transport system ATPase subunit
LLRILAAQARPSAGTVVVAGCRLPRQAAAARGQTGVVAHANLLYDDLSGLENLVFYGRLYGLEHPRRRAQEVLELLKLQNLAGMRVRTLSHGQQKRLSIGRAILHKPRLLLLDEAEAGLDAESLQVLQELVAEWVAPGRAEPQRAVVMTTHNQGLGHAWATRALELRNGQLQPLLARETAGRGTAR